MTKPAKTQTPQFAPIPVGDIAPDPRQPRKYTDAAKDAELLASVREKGVLQAIKLRPNPTGKGKPFWLVYGQRRWVAAKGAKLATIPAVVCALTDREALEEQLTENAHRSDISPLEEAAAFTRLLELGATVADAALNTGHSEKLVRGRIRLLNLPEKAQTALLAGELQLGVANAICWLDAPADREAATERILAKFDGMGLKVKLAEEYIRRQFLLVLSKAAFSTTDAALVAKAGACLNCEKRTGARAVLFDDIQSEDSCLDSVCYAEKVKAHVVQVTEQAFANNEKLATPAVLKKVFAVSDSHISTNSEFVNLAEPANPGGNEKRPWAKLVGKETPGVITAIAPTTGKVFKILPRATAVELAEKHSGVKFNGGGLSSSLRAQAAVEQRQAKARKVVLIEFLAHFARDIEARFSPPLNPPGDLNFWQTIVEASLHNLRNDTARLLLQRCGIEYKKHVNGDCTATLIRSLKKFKTVEEVLALLFEGQVAEKLYWWTSPNSKHQPDGLNLQLAEASGFDLKAALKRADEELQPKAKKDKPASAPAQPALVVPARLPDEVAAALTCAECKIRCGHQATCSQYIFKTGTPVQSFPNDAGLTYAEYLIWAEGTQQKNPASVAKHAQNKRDRDSEVIAWLIAYVKGSDLADGFTAPRCTECKRLDGAHDVDCAKHKDYQPPKTRKTKAAQPVITRQKGGPQ
jgi:ParB/RepB/Spo0J family partition protein